MNFLIQQMIYFEYFLQQFEKRFEAKEFHELDEELENSNLF